jgi:Fe-S-cluster containining protein
MADLERDLEGTESYIQAEWLPVSENTLWKCIRCGWCCHQDWRLNVTWLEHDKLISYGKKNIPEFKLMEDPGTGLNHPYFVIENKCPLLQEEGMTCTIHPDWFYTCATYPFLLMPDGTLMYHKGCNGIGKGKPVNMKEMKDKVLEERRKAGMIR